ncbi:predicted protein [Thalassiosira pseudonana CCMP1335]|uniref:Uncharacterized protein n=1 Tax=Thalassiosira pseudonana TaxID=35128 RepID=B8C937_THAPS|nr:predicted protein [Thalassiosira pseudonana CCMP1335]EED89784.1 predicted protein [Thalassiosira pseudonana CCMP1335]
MPKYTTQHQRRHNYISCFSLSKILTTILLFTLTPPPIVIVHHPHHDTSTTTTTASLLPQLLPPVSASGLLADLATQLTNRIFPPEDYIDEDIDIETRTFTIVEISDMRARDIKRRLARYHGYGADELGRMIDKKDLINTLSYEEHKVFQAEVDKRKWRRFKMTVVYTVGAVVLVMFWPLIKHAWEVAKVNLEVYTDRRKHEIGRCREFNSFKGYFGIFLLFIIDMLSMWLSISVLLSWVMTSKYFFPVPSLPIRPAQLLTPKGGDAGALGKYGINVGPMVISWLFRFLNGRVEAMIGKAMAAAFQDQRRREKEDMKRMRKEERAKEKEAKREAKREAKAREAEESSRREAMGETEEDEVTNNNVDATTMSSDVDLDADVTLEDTGTSNFDDLD